MPEHVHDPDEAAPPDDGVLDTAIKIAYLLVIAGNLIVMYDLLKDTPPVVQLREAVRQGWAKLQNCEGCAKRRAAFRAAHNRMMFEATELLAEGEEQQHDG